MRRYCEDIGEYVDAADCSMCDDSECQFSGVHPTEADVDAEARLEKFRSSEFASDVLAKMAKVFGVSPELASTRLETLFAQFQKQCDKAVADATTVALRLAATRYIDGKLQAELDALFTKAVEERIQSLRDDDTTMIETIRDRATKRIKQFLASKKQDVRRGSGENDPLNKLIETVVDQRVKGALEELQKEAIDRFDKETMKKMMSGMAKAIGQDKRLLALLG